MNTAGDSHSISLLVLQARPSMRVLPAMNTILPAEFKLNLDSYYLMLGVVLEDLSEILLASHKQKLLVLITMNISVKELKDSMRKLD